MSLPALLRPAARRRRTAGAAAVACLGCLARAGRALAQPAEPVEIDFTGPAAVKLAVVVAVLVIVLVSFGRVRLPQVVRAVVLWGGLLLLLVAAYTYRAPLQSAGREIVSVLMPGVAVTSGGEVVVRRAFPGHFEIEAQVDGAPVRFLFDTGASVVVLTAEDAARAGFNPAALDYKVPVMTAGGMTRVAPVRIGEIVIADIRVRDVRGAVAKRGDLDQSLLGMTFLNRLDGFEVRRDRLVLKP